MTHNSVEVRPTWQEYKDRVRNEVLAAAMAVLEVDPYRVVLQDAANWLRYTPVGDGRLVDGVFQPDPCLEWGGWAESVDRIGRGWSSTQWRLFEVAAGLATGREFNIVGVLDGLNEWTGPVWRVLLAWSAGGTAEEIGGAAATD